VKTMLLEAALHFVVFTNFYI